MDSGRTVVTTEARRRWGLVLGLAVVLAAIPVAIDRWPVRAAAIDLATLRARVAASTTQAYQGYAQSSGLLGLPTLANLAGITALASGVTEMRTWYASADRWRVDVLGDGTENDLYQTPDAQISWDFGGNRLTRIEGAQPVRLPRPADVTPPALARRLLAGALAGTTDDPAGTTDDPAGTTDALAGAADERVEPLAAKRVAGVDAAGLRIVPSSPDTTVAHVDIWADPVRGLPLQAEITAKGGTRPVFTTRFLEIHFSTPDAAVLTPPAPRPGIGYTVAEAPDILGFLNRRRPVPLPASVAGLARTDAVAGLSAAGAYGTGLTSVVVAALLGRFGGEAYQQIETYGQSVTVPGGSEAAMITTGLLTVLSVRSGNRTFLVAGLVEPALMQRVATDLAGSAP